MQDPDAAPAPTKARVRKAKNTAAAAKPNEVASELVGPATKGRTVAPLDPLAKIRAGLAELAKQAKPFDLTTAAGEKDARAFRALCVSTRTAADGAYETINRPILNLQRDARALLAAIKDEVKKHEDPVDKAIKAAEEAREAERQRKLQEIAARNAAIRTAITAAFTLPAAYMRAKPAAAIRETIAALEAKPIDEQYGDLTMEAEESKAAALEALAAELAIAEERERQQAELDRQREELAEQKRKDAAEHQAAVARQLEEERAAQTRMQKAGPLMLEALETWAALDAEGVVYAEPSVQGPNVWQLARSRRDAAIAEAHGTAAEEGNDG